MSLQFTANAYYVPPVEGVSFKPSKSVVKITEEIRTFLCNLYQDAAALGNLNQWENCERYDRLDVTEGVLRQPGVEDIETSLRAILDEVYPNSQRYTPTFGAQLYQSHESETAHYRKIRLDVAYMVQKAKPELGYWLIRVTGTETFTQSEPWLAKPRNKGKGKQVQFLEPHEQSSLAPTATTCPCGDSASQQCHSAPCCEEDILSPCSSLLASAAPSERSWYSSFGLKVLSFSGL